MIILEVCYRQGLTRALPSNLTVLLYIGVMESTMIKAFARAANLRRWLRRPDCPEAVRQLKRLFDKSFVPANAISETQEFIKMRGACRAYAKHDGVNFCGFTTHAGNANIMYRCTPSGALTAGQIQWIENVQN